MFLLRVLVLDHLEVRLIGQLVGCLVRDARFRERLDAGSPLDVGRFAIGAPRPARDDTAVEPDRIAQLVELALRELARIADAEIVERQVRERDALQLVDAEAERFDHPVDLAVLALVDRDPEPRMPGLAGKELDLGGEREGAVVETDAITEELDVIGRELAVHLHVVGLRHVRGGREEAGRELAIVGEEEDAFRVEVEPADRLDRHGHVREVVHHRQATAIVGDGGDAGLRFVEEDVELVVRDDGLAIDLDLVPFGIDLRAEHADDLAVDADTARGDELFGLTPGRHARRSEVALQSYGGSH
jgi:hypothetical protein